MENEFLDLKIEEAIKRIRDAYEWTDGKIYLSFSGGKDSTVVAELIKMANLPIKIPFMFANTGLEFDVILKFVKEYDYENIVIVKPSKPMGQIIKEYGKPALSKFRSEQLATYGRNMDDPLKRARVRMLISGQAEKAGKMLGFRTKGALAEKHFHFLHPDRDYTVANKCCWYMKKEPSHNFAGEHDMRGVYLGIRLEEGGSRTMIYKSCTSVKTVHNKPHMRSLPIFDWTDELMNAFIEKYNVPLSEAYTKYGCERTGCVGCPFGRNVAKELEITAKYEPNRYKAALFFLKDVYADQDVKLPFDPEYTKYYEERKKVNEVRRKEMLEKYKDLRSWKFDNKEEEG